MSYRFIADESCQNGIRRIAGEQIDRLIAELRDGALPPGATIHQIRKRCKKVRGLLRLFRSVLRDRYSEENARYRDAARSLSAVRDATAMIETYDAIRRRYADEVDGRVIAPIRRHLTMRQQALLADDASAQRRLQEFGETMVDGRESLASWTLSDEGLPAVAGGLRKAYARARKAKQAAYDEPSSKTFHEWRKRVKYHWHHMRLLRDVWPAVMRARADEVDALGEMLGDHHNLSVLRSLLLADPDCVARKEAIVIFTGLIDRRQRDLQAACRPLGERLFAEKPKRFVSRLGDYWEVWRSG